MSYYIVWGTPRFCSHVHPCLAESRNGQVQNQPEEFVRAWGWFGLVILITHGGCHERDRRTSFQTLIVDLGHFTILKSSFSGMADGQQPRELRPQVERDIQGTTPVSTRNLVRQRSPILPSRDVTIWKHVYRLLESRREAMTFMTSTLDRLDA